MSLINRMLDELAARQAPGAESLIGVRLSDPMGEAQASLNSRKRWVLIAIALGAATIVWLLWPTPGPMSVPQSRVAVGGVLARAAAPAAIASAQPGASIAPPVITADDAAPRPFRPSLQLVSSLGSSSGMNSRAPQAARIQDKSEESVTIIDGDAGAPEPEAPAPRSARSIDSAPGPVTRGDGRNSRQNRKDSTPRHPDAGTLAAAADAQARVDADTTRPVSRTDTARDALSRGDPAAALEALEPVGSDRDVESASLRAAALQRLGRHLEAADAYRGLTHGDPAEPGHWVGLAISLEGQQKREEARIAYRRALQSPQLAPSLRAFALSRVTVLEEP